MKAVISQGASGPDAVELRDVEAPEPGPGEVLIRVHATALNRADLLQTRGLYPPPPGAPQEILGMEYAGEVVGVGPRTFLRRAGERVMGIVAGGSFAEQLVVHERETIRIPSGLAFAVAAAIPEAFLTAYDALFLQARAGPGESVLIHAVASGVGTAALQLVRAFGGVAIGTGRSAEKLARCQALGLSLALHVASSPPVFEAAVREATAGVGANVALDLVGGAYLRETVLAMAPRGRVMCVGTMDGPTAELNLGLVLRKRLQLTGTVLRSRPLEEKITLARSFEQHVLPLFEQDAVKAVVGETFPLADVRQALARLAANDTFGKVVLCM